MSNVSGAASAFICISIAPPIAYRLFDEAGVAWRLQREIVGARCRTSLQVRIDIGPAGQVVHREILYGRFLTPEETIAAP